ncbi:MAG: thiamine pyrophosphate-dependent enzyme, partial [Cellvibrionaceae bacterium]|nr:thiamine pyrophosphate-dependent enzyme [Cellvibrionaceae bacterium]
LGYDMVEYHPKLWNGNQDKKILHIDFLSAEIDENYHPEIEVVGDLAHALWMLNERADAYGADNFDFDLSQQTAVRRDMSEELARHKDDSGEGPIRPQKALWDARAVMGPEDILLSDVGAHKMWIARHYQCHEPNTCLIPNGFCSMGFALPGAIAAALVNPDKNILAISGDAGFMMNMQEMETAKRLGCNMTVMVWDDGGYGLIKWKQENEFGKHTELDFSNPDWVPMAEAFGWHAQKVTQAEDLQGALQTAFDTQGPSLVVIPIDYSENKKLTERLGELTCSI